MSLPPLPASSSLNPRKASSGAIFLTAFVIFCDALESAAMSTFITIVLRPAAIASSTSCFTTFIILSTRWASAAFLASFAFFWIPSIRALNSALTTAEMNAASTSFRTAPACLSRSGVSTPSASTSATSASYLSPSFLACTAASLVTAEIRRIPLATAVSSTKTKASASAVFETCVPPQNSIEVSSPTETTRTGSGYTSPNTARTPSIS
mmetsp:Transcript_33921/g.82250  ORF Transcript_33921/g.82250 Transcript_33921/m.82250 type:complete len:209 (-) Transcript_33921:2306-2932(-)